MKVLMAENEDQEETNALKVFVTGFGVRLATILQLFDSAVQ
jgi:hypothetical protein